jgi:hypothetical protein
MATTNFGNSLYGTGITISGLASLASGSVGTGTQFANPLLGTATGAYATNADLVLVMGATFTTGAGTPNLQAVLLAGGSGVGETGRVSSSQLFPTFGVSQANLIPSLGYTGTEWIMVKGIWVPSSPYLTLALLNNSGAALPATGMTATLYLYGGAAG